MELAVFAGVLSTVLFASANLPMVVKAIRSRDLASYSRPSLALANVGNIVHTIYVVSLPFGPVWILHGFYLVTTAAMFVMALRYRADASPAGASRVAPVVGSRLSVKGSGRGCSRAEGRTLLWRSATAWECAVAMLRLSVFVRKGQAVGGSRRCDERHHRL